MNMRVAGNQFMDKYSLRHFLSGLFLGVTLTLVRERFGYFDLASHYFLVGFAWLSAWEILEIIFREVKKDSREDYKKMIKILPAHIFYRESLVNILSDIFWGMFGMAIIYLLLEL